MGSETIALKLSPLEMDFARFVAESRIAYNLAVGARPKYGQAEEPDHDAHDFGAVGELAVAKALRLSWPPPLGVYDAPDVGGCIEVRSIEDVRHKLIAHKPDGKRNPPNLPHVLAYVGERPSVELLGWCYGFEAQREEFWSDPTGRGRWAYFVPQSALKPMWRLVRVLIERERRLSQQVAAE